jgi:hypothetical protein
MSWFDECPLPCKDFRVESGRPAVRDYRIVGCVPTAGCLIAIYTAPVLYSNEAGVKIILYWYGIKLLVPAVLPEREICSDLTN